MHAPVPVLACQAQVLPKRFFLGQSDRTDRVSNERTPAAVKKRVQVRHVVCDPVQIRKNPATGSAPKSRVNGIQSVAWESGIGRG